MTGFNFSFIRFSTNYKVGPMPVTRTDKKSCPSTCPLLGNGCYAGAGHSNIHWKKLDNGGLNIDQLAALIKKLPIGTIWRHNEAGDLPHTGDNQTIDGQLLGKIVAANSRKNGFTYTHYPLTQQNIETLKQANEKGFTINVSANNFEELDFAMEQNLPSVVMVDENSPNKFTTKNGNKVIVCPNQLKDKITCIECGLCQQKDRKFAIAFKLHGIGKNKAKKALQIV
jgi:hypothetical protein